MKSVGIFLVLAWVFLFIPSVLSQTPLVASSFFSNGDLIHGWYWLRDNDFENLAEWTFEGVPVGEEDLVLDLEILATDRLNGPRGINARFYLSWGIPPYSTQGGLILGVKEVFLPNVSPPSDPVGYTCRGRVVVPRSNMESASIIWIRVHRSYRPGERGTSPSFIHVAFRKESVKLLFPQAEGGTVSPSPTPYITPIPPPISYDADWRWEAETIEPGTYSDSLGTDPMDPSIMTTGIVSPFYLDRLFALP